MEQVRNLNTNDNTTLVKALICIIYTGIFPLQYSCPKFPIMKPDLLHISIQYSLLEVSKYIYMQHKEIIMSQMRRDLKCSAELVRLQVCIESSEQ